jgi:hypothetical protein
MELRPPQLEPADLVAVVLALAVALVLVLAALGVVFNAVDAGPVLDVAGLVLAGVLGYLSGRNRHTT